MQVKGGWKKLRNYEMDDLYVSAILLGTGKFVLSTPLKLTRGYMPPPVLTSALHGVDHCHATAALHLRKHDANEETAWWAPEPVPAFGRRDEALDPAGI
jgi:hypothetical protein